MTRLNRHQRTMKLAAVIAEGSKDPSSHVGAVIVDPETSAVRSCGYNGFPLGVDDSKAERFENRDIRLAFTSHAEANAIVLAARHGTKLEGSHIYVTATPCCDCAKAIIQSGIKRVYIPSPCPFGNPENMRASYEATHAMFREAGVEVHGIDSGTVGATLFVRGKEIQI